MHATAFSTLTITGTTIHYLCVDKSKSGVTAQWLADRNTTCRMLMLEDHTQFTIESKDISDIVVDTLNAKFNKDDQDEVEDIDKSAEPRQPLSWLDSGVKFEKHLNGSYSLLIPVERGVHTTRWLESQGCTFDRRIGQNNACYKFLEISDEVVQKISAKYECIYHCEAVAMA